MVPKKSHKNRYLFDIKVSHTWFTMVPKNTVDLIQPYVDESFWISSNMVPEITDN